jgi:fatty acid desaturase
LAFPISLANATPGTCIKNYNAHSSSGKTPQECNGLKFILFGEFNYLKYLLHTFGLTFILALPLFLIGRIALSRRKQLAFLIPLFYLLLSIPLAFWGFWLQTFVKVSISFSLLFLALSLGYIPLYVLFFLPFILFVASLILSIYFTWRSNIPISTLKSPRFPGRQNPIRNRI